MGSFYSNLFNVQDFIQNRLVQELDMWSKSHVEFVNLELHNEIGDHISLNWHLTNKEKRQVFGSLHLQGNIDAVNRIVELLE